MWYQMICGKSLKITFLLQFFTNFKKLFWFNFAFKMMDGCNHYMALGVKGVLPYVKVANWHCHWHDFFKGCTYRLIMTCLVINTLIFSRIIRVRWIILAIRNVWCARLISEFELVGITKIPNVWTINILFYCSEWTNEGTILINAAIAERCSLWVVRMESQLGSIQYRYIR